MQANHCLSPRVKVCCCPGDGGGAEVKQPERPVVIGGHTLQCAACGEAGCCALLWAAKLHQRCSLQITPSISAQIFDVQCQVRLRCWQLCAKDMSSELTRRFSVASGAVCQILSTPSGLVAASRAASSAAAASVSTGAAAVSGVLQCAFRSTYLQHAAMLLSTAEP